MQTLIVKTDTPENANFLATFLRTVKTVKSVTVEINSKKALSRKKKAVETEPYNWINPTRPATDEEFEQLAFEMEQDKGKYNSEEVINFVNEELNLWRKKIK